MSTTTLPDLNLLPAEALKALVRAQHEQLLWRESEIEHLKLLWSWPETGFGEINRDVLDADSNEAFAAQSLAVIKDAGLDPEKVNPNGGAIALGHPLGCTGAKLTAGVIRELKRRKGRYGMVTMCVGGGMGAAGIFENLNWQRGYNSRQEGSIDSRPPSLRHAAVLRFPCLQSRTANSPDTGQWRFRVCD
jgi:Thiolase, C-terminal domain